MLVPYVLPGTAILRNILNLTTRQDLDDTEAEFASLRLRELAQKPHRRGLWHVAISGVSQVYLSESLRFGWRT